MAFGPNDLANEMGVRLFGADYAKALAPVDTRNGWYPLVRDPYPGAWQRNEELGVDTQLSFYAVYACVTLIANDIGKLRPRLLELADGIWTEVQSPSFSPVLRKPNRFQNHIQFKEWWITSKLTRGNTYALKQRDGRGVVTALYLLDPAKVTPLVTEQGGIYYRLNTDNIAGIEDEVTVPASEIIHDRMNCLFHPLVGVSPLYGAGRAASQGIAIQDQSRTFFGNGARPSGVLTAPGAISDETAKRMQEAWDAKFSGSNSGRVAVLGDGLSYEPMVMTATDAQTVEQLRMSAEQVCAVYHVPPFKIGIGQQPTHQNGELLNQQYYDNCLQSLIEQFELCMDEGLGIGEGVSVQGRVLGMDLDLEGLLRMDTATQVRTLSEAVKGSLMRVNEGRRRLDLPPVEGGDVIWAQQQNWPLRDLAKRPIEALVPNAPAAPPSSDDPPSEDDEAERFARALARNLELQEAA